MEPILAFALVGALGVGSQWLAWRLRLPAIVLMLAAGVLVGPVFGLFEPERDIGALTGPMISLAVAVILFEGGLSLNFSALRDASKGVARLVLIGAPLGWLTSTLALHYGVGLGWASASVFGGILIVTGPTVIAPLLRQARLARRPAALLQWEAIVNDPIGALAAVLAFELVLVLRAEETFGAAIWSLVIGLAVAAALGLVAGQGLVWLFRRGLAPEYMKVPILFAAILVVFALSDHVLHESGLLAVTVMGLKIANAGLPSYDEMRRFKEHATILLVSGVFILLAASLDLSTLAQLDWRAGLGIALVVLVARPLTVLLALARTDVPWPERWLIALTGPRGVVLVAVAGLFGERLAGLGIADAERIAPLAFALVVVTVVLNGFGLVPLARWLGLSGKEAPGLLIVGGSRFAVALAEVLGKAGVPVLISDPNPARLRAARGAGVPVFYGDILSEAAEHSVELVAYGSLLAATWNDAYNTLVATDFAPEFGRANVWQVGREKADKARHALPASLEARILGGGETLDHFEGRVAQGWTLRLTRLSEEFGFEDWQETHPEAQMLGRLTPAGELRLMSGPGERKLPPGTRVLALTPPEAARAAAG
ncbi:cation:proton antiporter [Frigidibacter sp. ROC022]|uniref:cation:proton antiporter n=1 Tax=Frigidibacter sp. ROC022 TaxID=2971796 RepID=UPI00215B4A96|nr:sodium:proton antiporter [Frigidibacter sp. ROC022]MCR8723789.1 cation:proton antiporter [Frigidibacter sp. ROC022]